MYIRSIIKPTPKFGQTFLVFFRSPAAFVLRKTVCIYNKFFKYNLFFVRAKKNRVATYWTHHRVSNLDHINVQKCDLVENTIRGLTKISWKKIHFRLPVLTVAGMGPFCFSWTPEKISLRSKKFEYCFYLALAVLFLHSFHLLCWHFLISISSEFFFKFWVIKISWNSPITS